MQVIIAFISVVFLTTMLIPFMSVKWKGILSVTAVVALTGLSSIVAVKALSGKSIEYLFNGSSVTGQIPLRIDALSGFFILVINFTFLTGAFYGLQYMKAYREQKSNLSLHCISYILALASLTGICIIQNTIVFLIAWEVMALSSFLLIIFEHNKGATLNAGINFLIQSHVCIMFLMLGFIWVALKTNSYDFRAITAYSTSNSPLTGFCLFFCFFIGFAIKAGFVPFHTWLPYAHPAAPSHVSGIMSGVIIKIGIYGILRMLLVIKSDYLVIGYIILFISILSGIYGVMLAIVQHNLKRLLAYHSIENIGIIGMGIGLGCIGIGMQNTALTFFGFAGALLHVLNHSLFKSLLFYGAGSIYQATHTMDIDRLGGIGKKMPQTSFLFLIASLAICGLPPFNGFVSEFLVYSGLFTGLKGSDKTLLSWIVFGLFSLPLIGGLAVFCFTKAFGSVFLGRSRHQLPATPKEAVTGKLIPMYAVICFITAIGIFPRFFIASFAKAIALFTSNPDKNISLDGYPAVETLTMIGWSAAGFCLLVALIYFIRKKITTGRSVYYDATWGCGYTGSTEKMQYSASSFVRTYRKLAEPILSIKKKKKEIKKVFPKSVLQETHPHDKVEEWMIDYPLQIMKRFFNRFTFLQNGNLQFYILYGIVFISLVLGIPFVAEYLKLLIGFLNQL
jgi:hydrogenase-4 component B